MTIPNWDEFLHRKSHLLIKAYESRKKQIPKKISATKVRAHPPFRRVKWRKRVWG